MIENKVISAYENKERFSGSKEFMNLLNNAESNSIAKMLVFGYSDMYVQYYPECLPFVTE